MGVLGLGVVLESQISIVSMYDMLKGLRLHGASDGYICHLLIFSFTAPLH